MYLSKEKMAFALLNILEAPIAKRIYELAQDPEETQVKVVFQNHPLLKDEGYYVTIPKKNAMAEDLRQHMSEIPRFEMHGWVPAEFRFFAISLSQGLLAELGAGDKLKLAQTLVWQEDSSGEDNPGEAVIWREEVED